MSQPNFSVRNHPPTSNTPGKPHVKVRGGKKTFKEKTYELLLLVWLTPNTESTCGTSIQNMYQH